jgi:hypothetical protein
MTRLRVAVALGLVASAVVVPERAPAQVSRDSALASIRAEGARRSHVLEMARVLTDRFGARLTNSPSFDSATTWAARTLESFGAAGRVERWGPFEWPAWSNRRFVARMTLPRSSTLHALPAAWSSSTGGAREGDVVFVEGLRPESFDAYHGRLRGKWVIPLRPAQTVPGAASHPRYTEADLAAMTTPLPVRSPMGAADLAAAKANLNAGVDARCRALSDLMLSEGALGMLSPYAPHDGHETPYDGSCGMALYAHPRAPLSDGHSPTPPVVLVSPEDAGRMLRLIDAGERVRVAIDMENDVRTGDGTSVNVIGELSGSDPQLRDQVVMIGAHLDSWTVGTGATDNGANAAVMLEAMRILAATHVPLRRTVRIALWGGEEQITLGSKAYARQHFGWIDERGLHRGPEYDRLDAYFNLDNGVGSIRGINLQGFDSTAAQFTRWMHPLRDLGVTTVAPRMTGSTDHTSFSTLGLPAFQFIQDPLEYFTTTWHTDLDTYDHVPPTDLVRNAITIATLVYEAANDDARLPRWQGLR